MRIVVVGAGVIGVASAYWLARDGHEVTVVDRTEAVGNGASGVNAGLLALAESPWASPAAPRNLLRSLRGRGGGPIRLGAGAGPRLVPWGVRFLRECRPRRWRRNLAATHALSVHSYEQLQLLLAEGPIEFGHERNGMVLLHRRGTELRDEMSALAPLAAAGEPIRSLTSAELVALDPGFEPIAGQLDGAIYSSRSGHGDCRAFTEGLAARARERGVAFSLGVEALGFQTERGRVVACETAAGPLSADAFVLAAGAASSRLLRSAGLRVPIMPVSGFSMTVPLTDPQRGPRIGGVDQDRHLAFSRVGDAMRLSSTAEFRGHRLDYTPADFTAIRRGGAALFPRLLDWERASFGCGLRPVTPAGLPLIGRSRRANLFLNGGHGHLGWTQACGSAQLLADLVAGRPPALDPAPYLPAEPRPHSLPTARM